jgi:hypothetical protein
MHVIAKPILIESWTNRRVPEDGHRVMRTGIFTDFS